MTTTTKKTRDERTLKEISLLLERFIFNYQPEGWRNKVGLTFPCNIHITSEYEISWILKVGEEDGEAKLRNYLSEHHDRLLSRWIVIDAIVAFLNQNTFQEYYGFSWGG